MTPIRVVPRGTLREDTALPAVIPTETRLTDAVVASEARSRAASMDLRSLFKRKRPDMRNAADRDRSRIGDPSTALVAAAPHSAQDDSEVLVAAAPHTARDDVRWRHAPPPVFTRALRSLRTALDPTD